MYQTVQGFRVCGQLYPRGKNLSHTKKNFDQGKTVRDEEPRNENNYNIPGKQKKESFCPYDCAVQTDRSLINSAPLPD